MKTPNKDALIRIAGALCREKFNPGIDGMTASQNYNHILLNGDLIEKRLAEGEYTPKPALLFAIMNRKGRQREVCRFTAMDVTIQRALAELLADEVTEGFSNGECLGGGKCAPLVRTQTLPTPRKNLSKVGLPPYSSRSRCFSPSAS